MGGINFPQRATAMPLGMVALTHHSTVVVLSTNNPTPLQHHHRWSYETVCVAINRLPSH